MKELEEFEADRTSPETVMKAQDLIAPRMIEDEEIDDEAMRKEKAEPNPIVQRLLKMREVLKQAAIHAKLNFPPLLPGEGARRRVEWIAILCY